MSVPAPESAIPQMRIAYTVQNQAVILPSYTLFEYSPFVKKYLCRYFE